MTEIAFHFNAPDKTVYTCRLLRKALGSGARVVVVGPQPKLDQLDLALWTFTAVDFLPHCFSSAEPAQLAASPVVLAEAASAGIPHRQVLVNLGNDVPSGFEQFERLIELVGEPEQDRQAARRRWKHYADRGYAIVRHDLATQA